MAVELGGTSLTRLTQVAVQERARVVRHDVPGLQGDLMQVLGRASVAVRLEGVFLGPDAAEDLGRLRTAHVDGRPVDFYTEAVGEGYFTQVLITHLDVWQRAGYLDQFAFACEVAEYVEPPEPLAADPLGALDAGLLDEAAGFIDDVQNALDEVSGLVDLVAGAPSFGDPTTALGGMLDDYETLTGGGLETLAALRDLF